MCLRQLMLATLLFAAGPARAAEILYQNDGWTDGGQVYCQAGFAIGEEAAVTLGPLTEAGVITSVELLFCGATTPQTVGLRIYADDGSAQPGTLRYEGEVQLTGADDALQVIDLSGMSLTVLGGKSFRVSLVFEHAGVPSVSRDDDGSIQPGRNWINASGTGWIDSRSAGLTGDWVIRARVNTGDTADGAPLPAIADGQGGCGCASGGATPFAILALVVLGNRRRIR